MDIEIIAEGLQFPEDPIAAPVPRRRSPRRRRRLAGDRPAGEAPPPGALLALKFLACG